MMILPVGVEHALDVAVQRSHYANARPRKKDTAHESKNRPTPFSG
jgi:hypothetical protein